MKKQVVLLLCLSIVSFLGAVKPKEPNTRSSTETFLNAVTSNGIARKTRRSRIPRRQSAINRRRYYGIIRRSVGGVTIPTS